MAKVRGARHRPQHEEIHDSLAQQDTPIANVHNILLRGRAARLDNTKRRTRTADRGIGHNLHIILHNKHVRHETCKGRHVGDMVRHVDKRHGARAARSVPYLQGKQGFGCL